MVLMSACREFSVPNRDAANLFDAAVRRRVEDMIVFVTQIAG